MRKLIIITIIIILFTNVIYAVSPTISQRIYWPGMWNANQSWGDFKLGHFRPDTLSISWTVYSSDPAIGYPYHTGNVQGVNDTAKVRVYFDNRTEDDYSIASASPETWIYPVLYDPYVDVFISPILADTNDFEYRFEHWISMKKDLIISKPDTIFSGPSSGWGKTYGIIFSIWGVYPGTFRVILKPTGSIPSDIALTLDNSGNYFTITQGQDLLDTLNSYSAIATNAMLRKEYSLFNTYVTNIFNLNSQSLIGWALRYHGYKTQTDTTNALVALDSLIYNLENRIDPQIPDTSEITPTQDDWIKQWTADYKYYRSRMLSPMRWMMNPR